MQQKPRVLSLESRMGVEMMRLFDKAGFAVTQVPTMSERALADQPEAQAFASVLEKGACDALILLTGVGGQMLWDAIAPQDPSLPDPRKAWFENLPILCRGPKPVAMLKKLGLAPKLVAPEPNTWRELITELDRVQFPLKDQAIYIQEYGRPNPELIQALKERGARVFSVPVYGWQIPDDRSEIDAALNQIVQGGFDAISITSGFQIDVLFQVRNESEAAKRAVPSEEDLRVAMQKLILASIGPMSSERLVAHGLAPSFEPEHPKMGHLVQRLKQHFFPVAAR